MKIGGHTELTAQLTIDTDEARALLVWCNHVGALLVCCNHVGAFVEYLKATTTGVPEMLAGLNTEKAFGATLEDIAEECRNLVDIEAKAQAMLTPKR